MADCRRGAALPRPQHLPTIKNAHEKAADGNWWPYFFRKNLDLCEKNSGGGLSKPPVFCYTDKVRPFCMAAQLRKNRRPADAITVRCGTTTSSGGSMRGARRMWTDALVLYVLKTRTRQTRVGLTATKIGGLRRSAHRARRVMKAAIDEHLDYNIGGYNLIFVARAATPGLKSWQVSRAVARLFKAAGLPDRALAPGAPPPASRPPRRKEAPAGEGAAREPAATSLPGCPLPAIRLYKRFLSPALGRNCRFTPTCSEYAIQAIQTMAASRACFWPPGGFARCNPFGRWGYDPVPEPGRWKTPGGCSTRPRPEKLTLLLVTARQL